MFYLLLGVVAWVLVILLLVGWAFKPTPRRSGEKEEKEPWIWGHSQNLNEKAAWSTMLGLRAGYWESRINGRESKERLGSMWRAGRCWLYLARGQYTLHCEWHFWHRSAFRVGVQFGGMGDDNILLTLSSPLVSLYLGLESRAGLRWLPEDKECSISVHSWALRINPWSSAHGDWCRKDPWWRRGVAIHIDDLLLGSSRYSEVDLQQQVPVLVPMPEGTYTGTARLFESEWRRRWYWPATRLLRVEINIPGGIPYEGKGENSWDCGEDATYGITVQAGTMEEGIGKMVASVMESRRRYGGHVTHRDLSVVLAPRREE